MTPSHIVVVGAGIGGLTAAALLLQAGQRVTVLEAHVDPGGCAATFFHRGYRFDTGATLAGGFGPAGPHARLAEALGLTWPIRPADPAWIVHLPGRTITQWADPARWQAERAAAFPGTEAFWHTQEKLARIAWDLSARSFPWPPQSAHEWLQVLTALDARTLSAAPYLGQTIAGFAPRHLPDLTTFLDAQLLISAQTTSRAAQALYGSAALDLPRRGVNHVRGGMGGLAATLADWITAHGGVIHYRQRVTRIEPQRGSAAAVHTEKGLRLSADQVIANLTPWALQRLTGTARPPSPLPPPSLDTWGAFTLYVALEGGRLPAQVAPHHQVVVDPRQPLGEGNSVFISLSAAEDPERAPSGGRAATLSTHTRLGPWWAAEQSGPDRYEARKAAYAARLLHAAEQALPGFQAAVRFQLPGTPLTFERYTGRTLGMVGGFPQTSLFQARGPRTAWPNVWLVGDSIFPGQSTAGVTVGAFRVAAEVLRRCAPPSRSALSPRR